DEEAKAAEAKAKADEEAKAAEAKAKADEEAKAAEAKAKADEEAKAAEAKAKADKARVVELKDKDTGFWDPVTGFQVVRDQQVKLGSKVGDATQVALESGRLLIVGK
ncbi:MAG: hypothetical protein IT173_12565, partial [Acidobacteria bacterium]|nr:hypothetical protein [Acidobacteriota bacterium]